jgi:hypothetical protein
MLSVKFDNRSFSLAGLCLAVALMLNFPNDLVNDFIIVSFT